MAAIFKDRVQRVLGHVTSHLGEDAVFYPCKGSSFAVQVVFDKEFEIVDPNSETVVSSNTPAVLVRLSDYPNGIHEGDQFQLDARYKVWTVQEDGQGGAVALMNRMS